MTGSQAAFLALQSQFLDLFRHGTPFTYAVLIVLVGFSLFSLTIIISKRSTFNSAQKSDAAFLRAFRKAPSIDGALAAGEQFRPAPLVGTFDRGYEEMARQMKTYNRVVNKESIARSLQIAISDELARLEHNLNWLATTASVSPFIGLFGTVLGIIRAFQNLGGAGSTNLAAVGPGIADALVATAVGLMAAIPAAIAYNHFGRQLKEMGDRMDNFSLEFLNFVERSSGE